MEANARSVTLFGYSGDELKGMNVSALVPGEARPGHCAQVMAYFRAPAARPMGVRSGLRGLRADGSTFPAEISLSGFQHGSARSAVRLCRVALRQAAMVTGPLGEARALGSGPRTVQVVLNLLSNAIHAVGARSRRGPDCTRGRSCG